MASSFTASVPSSAFRACTWQNFLVWYSMYRPVSLWACLARKSFFFIPLPEPPFDPRCCDSVLAGSESSCLTLLHLFMKLQGASTIRHSPEKHHVDSVTGASNSWHSPAMHHSESLMVFSSIRHSPNMHHAISLKGASSILHIPEMHHDKSLRGANNIWRTLQPTTMVHFLLWCSQLQFPVSLHLMYFLW